VLPSSVSGPSLLDGELTVNSEGGLEYLAFDCVAMGGRSLSNEVTHIRVERVAAFYAKYERDIANYPDIFEQKKRDTNSSEPFVAPPIVLRAKEHFKAADIGALLEQISCDEHGEYFFSDGRRRTKNDGLIFTPEENNYLMSYDPGALVKWKFLEKNTVDLKVKVPYVWRGSLDLFAGGKGQSDILFARIDMDSAENRSKFDALHSEMRRLSRYRNGFVPSFIVECAWNFATFQWELVQNRPDKHIPNFITVCTDTLRVMMDNVTEDELIAACNVDTAPVIDDYAHSAHSGQQYPMHGGHGQYGNGEEHHHHQNNGNHHHHQQGHHGGY